MAPNLRTILLSAIALIALGIPGCVYYDVYPDPPPYAPAHGYRYQYGGHHLVYDSGIGVYTVVGHPHIYYYDTHYYRYREPYWTLSVELDGPWHRVERRRIPPGLTKKHNHRGRGRG
jgi:hypothetical protein